MKKDSIDKLFENMEGQLDTYEPSVGHQMKFLEKLQQHNKQNNVVTLDSKKRNWLKPLAIAASITLVIGLATTNFMFTNNEEADLASISPQLQETQNFFTSAIEIQLEEIDNISTQETKELVADVMNQLEKIESDYETLKKDLVRSGNDKRVISAMIDNFKKRATLLEEVLQKINNINELKFLENENSIL